MGSRTPSSPLRAHHRYMRTLVSIAYEKKKLAPTPAELDRVSTVFQKAGGSWVGVFQGSIDDVCLLKKTLKIAAKKGYLSKAPEWSK